MKVYLQPPQPSRGLDRIAAALRRYAPPSVEVTDDRAAADLTVLYSIGRLNALGQQAAKIHLDGKRFAVVQVCLKSTMQPNPVAWLPLWHNAVVVWSYYDLSVWCLPNFYHAPLGVDAEVFYPRFTYATRNYTVLTTGLSRLSESIRECALAVEAVEGKGCHIGPYLRLGDRFSQYKDLSDDYLASLMSAAQFVSGLRRKEGFELPAAEGLLCGARPILFDTPDYRWAYRDWGEYIQETDRPGVVEQLVELFKRGARRVTAEERREAAMWFDWKRICEGFWERCQ